MKQQGETNSFNTEKLAGKRKTAEPSRNRGKKRTGARGQKVKHASKEGIGLKRGQASKLRAYEVSRKT